MHGTPPPFHLLTYNAAKGSGKGRAKT